jgi:hypothetical protein
VSLSLVRGTQVSLQQLVSGVRFTGTLALAQLVLFVPLGLILEISFHGVEASSFLALIFLLALWLHVATKLFCAFPLIVDRRMRLIAAFRASWHLTRPMYGVFLRVVLIIALISVPTLAILEDTVLNRALWMIFSSPVIALAFTFVYEWIRASNQHFRTLATPSSTPDMPVQGSGWTKTIQHSQEDNSNRTD